MLNITCRCGWDHDYYTLVEAKIDALDHLGCNDDGKVSIDEIENDPEPGEDFQTGRTYIVTSKKRKLKI